MIENLKIQTFILKSKFLQGFFNGKVVDNKDPESLSRVRVEIKNLTEGIAKTDLPFYPVKQSFSASPNASSSIPPIGSDVIVEFPNHDIYNGWVSFIIISKPPE